MNENNLVMSRFLNESFAPEDHLIFNHKPSNWPKKVFPGCHSVNPASFTATEVFPALHLTHSSLSFSLSLIQYNPSLCLSFCLFLSFSYTSPVCVWGYLLTLKSQRKGGGIRRDSLHVVFLFHSWLCVCVWQLLYVVWMCYCTVLERLYAVFPSIVCARKLS